MADVRVGSSAIQGLGVFATRGFAAYDTILTLDDTRVVDAARPLRPEAGEHEHHRDFLRGGRVVLMRAPERHINSSCDPNAYVVTRSGRRDVVALRPIAAGDEVTYDYVINCHGGTPWTCRCGSAGCRGTVPGSFFDLPAPEQIRLLPLLDRWFVTEHAESIQRLGGSRG